MLRYELRYSDQEISTLLVHTCKKSVKELLGILSFNLHKRQRKCQKRSSQVTKQRVRGENLCCIKYQLRALLRQSLSFLCFRWKSRS